MDLRYKRGTKGSVKFTLKGDHSERELSFVIKKGYLETDDRIITKLKSLGEITGTYSDVTKLTTCEVFFNKTDLEDVVVKPYPWDVDSISLVDPNDVDTPESGFFNLVQDVQTPFDGFALPESATRFLQIDARDFPVDIMIITDTINGVVVFRTITLEELKQKLDQIT